MSNRIGVYVCECGNNISDQVDMEGLLQQLSGLPGVVKVLPHRLICSKEGQDFLEEEIRKEELTHLVVAACSPRQHLTTFMDVCLRGGLNPYLLQMANIREQCAWVTADKEEATKKAARMIKAAIRRVIWQSPLPERQVAANPDVLVVGGGLSGMRTALGLTGPDRVVHLVEKRATLGGATRDKENATELAERLHKDPQVVVHLLSEPKTVRGFFGNFEVELSSGDEVLGIKVGSIVLCSGSRPMPREEMGYPGSDLPQVTTLPELQQDLAGHRQRLSYIDQPRMVLVHCAGRQKVGYCSGICCLCSFQAMRLLRESVPNARIIGLYQDICVPGREGEDYYRKTLEGGAEMVWGRLRGMEEGRQGCVLRYVSDDGSEREMCADLVVLVPATVPAEGSKELGEITGVDLGTEGFVTEGHEKIGPVATSIKGIYMAGSASGPRDERSAALLSSAVIGQIMAELVPGETLQLEAQTSQVCEELCTGCRNCMTVCTYGAIIYSPCFQACQVNEAICRGCGNCVAACPSGAISVKGATYGQILQEIREAVR